MATSNGLSVNISTAVGNTSPSSSKKHGHGTSLRKMECLVCQRVVFPPVMQCKNWHLVCNKCRHNRERCPDADCEEDIASATRSGVAEKYLEKYVARCRYFQESGEGCLDAFLKDDVDLLMEHEGVCFLREVKCLVPGCCKSIRYRTICEHFETEHFMPKNESAFTTFNVSHIIMQKKNLVNETSNEKSYKTVPCYIREGKDIFLTVFRLSSLRQPIFEISSIVHPYFNDASTTVISHYGCRISALNEDDSNASYKWEGPIGQSYPLIPTLSVADECAKLKWIVCIEIFRKPMSEA